MTQLALTLPPAARKRDHASSHEAADRVTRSGQREAHITRVVDAVRSHPGLTSKEIARLLGMDRVEVARRLPDAEKLGRVLAVKEQGKEIRWYAGPTG